LDIGLDAGQIAELLLTEAARDKLGAREISVDGSAAEIAKVCSTPSHRLSS
jgi:hypothetical protein